MKIQPLADRVLVEPLDEDEQVKGGIIIPDSAKEKPMEATVVAVGNGKTLDSGETRPVAVSVGDTVLFSKYSGTEVKIEGEEHLILREDDIIGIQYIYGAGIGSVTPLPVPGTFSIVMIIACFVPLGRRKSRQAERLWNRFRHRRNYAPHGGLVHHR